MGELDVLELQKLREFGALGVVLHPHRTAEVVAVDDRVLIREITHIVAVHKQAAGKIVGLLKSPMQIIVVVFALYDRVRNIQRPDPQPADEDVYKRQI